MNSPAVPGRLPLRCGGTHRHPRPSALGSMNTAMLVLNPCARAAGACAIWLSGGALAAAAQVATSALTIDSSAGPLTVQTVVGGLEHPWGLALLPDGRLLVTERPGRLRIVGADGRLSLPVPGTPRVHARGQGGLLDVALHPDFQSNRLVYLSFAEPGDGGASTAVGRGRLVEDRVEGFEVLFRQRPKVPGPNHFGGRIVFTRDGNLFLTLGERFKFEPAQDLGSHLGTIVRLRRDGGTPADNPFVGQRGALPEIWSYGHRNVEAAAIQPGSGTLWVAEMGPRGGDELNLPEAGKNYGWPVVSWGDHYDGRGIPDPPTRPEFSDAIRHWTPVISPSGLIFYTGDMFPAWRGSALIGGLSAHAVVRLAVDAGRVTGEERLALGARVRDVEQAADGAILVITDHENGALLRLSPAER